MFCRMCCVLRSARLLILGLGSGLGGVPLGRFGLVVGLLGRLARRILLLGHDGRLLALRVGCGMRLIAGTLSFGTLDTCSCIGLCLGRGIWLMPRCISGTRGTLEITSHLASLRFDDLGESFRRLA